MVVPSIIAARMYFVKYKEELLKSHKVLLGSAMRALQLMSRSIVKVDFSKKQEKLLQKVSK